jgi:hypothetical protein
MTKPAIPTELQEQQLLRKWLYYAAPEIKLVAVPNAARRTLWEIRQAKKEGLATGFPDMLVMAPGGLIAFIELKRTRGGDVSDNQAEWIERLNRYGFRAAVCRGADEAVAFLRDCGFAIRERAA